MRNRHIGSALLLVLVYSTLNLPTADADTTGVRTANSATDAQTGDVDTQPGLDEVTVEAHKRKLSQLRLQIKKSVDDFYDAFNKANKVAGYETRCDDEKPTGSHIARHICTPRFVQLANEGETQGYFDGHPTAPAWAVVALNMRGYTKQLRELIHTDPAVRQAAFDFQALVDRYNAVDKEKVKAN